MQALVCASELSQPSIVASGKHISFGAFALCFGYGVFNPDEIPASVAVEDDYLAHSDAGAFTFLQDLDYYPNGNNRQQKNAPNRCPIACA